MLNLKRHPISWFKTEAIEIFITRDMLKILRADQNTSGCGCGSQYQVKRENLCVKVSCSFPNLVSNSQNIATPAGMSERSGC